MSRYNAYVETVDQIVTDGVKRGILHLHTGSNSVNGNIIHLNDNPTINFGSCSYLGLEFDERLKVGSINAIEKYGTQFSESRAYVSVGLYEELETNFEKIFGYPCIVAPTTTLGHLSSIPVLVGDQDAVLLDHQVHSSVQTAATLLKPRGIHVELVRHNRIDLLEEKIKELRIKHKHIWYMADGVYSMFGDVTPAQDIETLLQKYPEFHFYVDDAHGMSCFGKNGSGYVLSKIKLHERMVLATSLAKAFATGGAVLVFPNKELARKVRTCGSTLITSGPMQPACLGAANSAAKIHLSSEIYDLQNDLQDNIQFANLMAKKYGLPLIKECNTPVFFIGVSLPKVGYGLIQKMLSDGYYVNLGVFPAVPTKNTGVRFTITRLHTFSQIERMIASMAHHLPIVLNEEGLNPNKIYEAFKLPVPEDIKSQDKVNELINQSKLKVELHSSIENIDAAEWNKLLGNRGSFDWNGLQTLEKSFTNNDLPENNWSFHYLIIRDLQRNPVLATFFTSALSKDDMLAPETISAQIEEKRKAGDPYYLVSKVLFMGSLLTEGDHLYVNKSSSLWQDAVKEMFNKIESLQESTKSTMTILRDLDGNDEEMDTLMLENGYIKSMMPDNHYYTNLLWTNPDGFLSKLSSKSRKHVKKYMDELKDCYDVKVCHNLSEDELDHFYNLYLNVKNNNLAVNTFTLPRSFFEQIASSADWDIISLSLQPAWAVEKPIGVIFAHKGATSYNPILVGINYNYRDQFMNYRQALYQMVLRANSLGLAQINLGYGASIEKQRLGAEINTPTAYVQAKDNFNLQVVSFSNNIKHTINS